MSLTPEQEQAVLELRRVTTVEGFPYYGVKPQAETVIELLSQSQSALDGVLESNRIIVKERDDAIGACSEWKEHAELSDKELCQLEDWLIGNAETDSKTGLIDRAAKCKERIRDLVAAEAERDELQAKLLASDAAGAEMRNQLELARHHYIRANALNLNQLNSMPTPYDVSTTCGQSFLDERERHVKALEKIDAECPHIDYPFDMGEVELCELKAWEKSKFGDIAREALKETK